MSSSPASSPQFTLYASKGASPNPFKVAILLERLGLSYSIARLEFTNDAQHGVKGASFLALNPNGRVPALVDHANADFTVWESGAVMHYLARKYDAAGRFLGSNPEQEATVLQWVTHQLSGLGPVQGNLNYCLHFWEPTYGESPSPSVRTRFEGESHRLYKVLDDQLARQAEKGSKYIALDRPTLADDAFYPWVKIHDFAKLDLSPYKHVNAWLETMRADAAVDKAEKKLTTAAAE